MSFQTCTVKKKMFRRTFVTKQYWLHCIVQTPKHLISYFVVYRRIIYRFECEDESFMSEFLSLSYIIYKLLFAAVPGMFVPTVFHASILCCILVGFNIVSVFLVKAFLKRFPESFFCLKTIWRNTFISWCYKIIVYILPTLNTTYNCNINVLVRCSLLWHLDIFF